MSGGSHNYISFKIDECLVDQMHDAELNDLIKDISKLAYELEWWESGDTVEEDYFNEVKKFKEKWFGSSREDRLKGYIDDKLNNMKEELIRMIGVQE